MAKLTDVTGRPHSGLVSNAVVAIVTDNVDPERLGRIKVKFPTLHNEPLSFWIRQSSPNGGKERGLYALPEIDDEVLVIFMQGSQDVGVIIGQFWNGVDIPPQEAEDAMPGSGKSDTGAEWSTELFTDGSTNIEKNDRRFWKSRSGHLFVFDDTSGSETIQMWDGSHTLSFTFDTAKQAIFLANTAGDIHIRTKNDLYLEAGNNIKYIAKNDIFGTAHNNMTIEVDMDYKFKAGMNAKHETGMNYEVKAGVDLTESAGNALKLSGSVSFSASGGATTEVSGGAMTKVKGGIVMIN
jgi:uncharacterized protein involved in type VI secretion and phage assembly